MDVIPAGKGGAKDEENWFVMSKLLVECLRTISDTSQGWRFLGNYSDQKSFSRVLKKLEECTDRQKEGRTSKMKHLCEEG